jgi:hypothetical protein
VGIVLFDVMAIRIVRGIDRSRNKKVYAYGRLAHPGLGVRKTYTHFRDAPTDGTPFEPWGFGSDLKFWLRADLGITTQTSEVLTWKCQASNLNFIKPWTGGGSAPSLISNDSRVNNQPTVEFNNSDELWNQLSNGPVITGAWAWLIIGSWTKATIANAWEINGGVSSIIGAGFLGTRQIYVTSYDQVNTLSAFNTKASPTNTEDTIGAMMLTQDPTGDLQTTSFGIYSPRVYMPSVTYVSGPTNIKLDGSLTMRNKFGETNAIAEILVISKPISQLYRLTNYVRERYAIDIAP